MSTVAPTLRACSTLMAVFGPHGRPESELRKNVYRKSVTARTPTWEATLLNAPNERELSRLRRLIEDCPLATRRSPKRKCEIMSAYGKEEPNGERPSWGRKMMSSVRLQPEHGADLHHSRAYYRAAVETLETPSEPILCIRKLVYADGMPLMHDATYLAVDANEAMIEETGSRC